MAPACISPQWRSFWRRPRGTPCPVLPLTLAATKTIPVSSVALILGVHRILSSAFVFTNIAGNCVATLVVGSWEKALNKTQLQTELAAGYRADRLPMT